MDPIEEDLPAGAEAIDEESEALEVEEWNEGPEVEEEDDENLEQALKNVRLQREKDMPAEVRPTITKQPEVIDDFIRNFLVNSNLTETLATFESEWYEQKTKAENAGKPDTTFVVPDTYIHNSQLIEQVSLLTAELKTVKQQLSETQDKYEAVWKQRDFHKLSHNRVVQEKTKLQKDLKRLQLHNNAMEPVLTELRMKNENVMKERMLIRLDRDKLQAKVKTLEEMVSKLEGAPKGVVTTPAGEKTRKAAGSTWPADNREPTTKRRAAPPTNLTNLTCRTTFKGHSMTVTGAAVHPKKQVVATSSDDTTWRIWAVPSGELIMSGDGHKDWVSGVQFHPKGTHVATCSGDGTVKVWDLVKSGCAHTFTDHTKGVWDVCWHDHGDFLASCSLDHTVRVWDATLGKPRQTLRGHVDSVNSVQFQPYSNMLITASGDKTVSLWDPRTGFCVHTFYGHANAVNQASFSSTGDSLASVDADGMVVIWDMRQICEVSKESCGPHPANGCAFDRSDKNVAVGSDDSSVYLYNLEERKISTLRGHEDAVQTICFSMDNSYLITTSSDGTAKYWA